MQYIDYIQPKDEQQGIWQPNHTPTTEWQNTHSNYKMARYAAYSHYTQRI